MYDIKVVNVMLKAKEKGVVPTLSLARRLRSMFDLISKPPRSSSMADRHVSVEVWRDSDIQRMLRVDYVISPLVNLPLLFIFISVHPIRPDTVLPFHLVTCFVQRL